MDEVNVQEGYTMYIIACSFTEVYLYANIVGLRRELDRLYPERSRIQTHDKLTFLEPVSCNRMNDGIQNTLPMSRGRGA